MLFKHMSRDCVRGLSDKTSRWSMQRVNETESIRVSSSSCDTDHGRGATAASTTSVLDNDVPERERKWLSELTVAVVFEYDVLDTSQRIAPLAKPTRSIYSFERETNRLVREGTPTETYSSTQAATGTAFASSE